MCRHLAYLGPPIPLSRLLFELPHALCHQSWAPRDMRGGGTINADGFGAGWYTPAGSVRYRRGTPMWSDTTLPALAESLTVGAVLAAVRSATAGMPVTETAAAPFGDGPWLFSHNGVLPDWPDVADKLAPDIAVSRLLVEGAATDSTLLWALVRQRLEAGVEPVRAIAEVANRARELPGARANFLLHTGTEIVATAAGDSLCHLTGLHPDPDGNPARGVIVASEPFDDSDGWVEVPDDHLIHVTRTDLTIHQLAEVP